MVNGLMGKLMFRELKKNWFQYLSMFVITVLAVTLFLGFISNTLTLKKRAERYFEESNLADLILQVTTFEDGDKQYLEEKGYDKLEYRTYSDGEFAPVREDAVDRNTAKIYISDGEVNKPYIVKGEAGFLIDETIARLHGYSVGDVMKVEFTTFQDAMKSISEQYTPLLQLFGYLEAGKSLDIPFVYQFEITGLMNSVEGVIVYSNSPVFVMPALMEDKVTDAIFAQLKEGAMERQSVADIVSSMMEGLRNQALVRCQNYSSVKEEMQGFFAEKEESNLVFVFDRDTMESVAYLDNEVNQSKNMLYIFPVIFFLVSILVIMTSISRLILRERINIGTFKALGLSNVRIMFHYATMSAVITLFGSAVGALIGPLIVPAVMTIKYGLIFSLPKLTSVVYSFWWTLGTMLVVSFLSLLIGIWASRSIIKENPAECMRPKQVTYRPHVKESKGKKSEGGGNHVLLSFRMALRNIRINRGRSLMTIIGVLGCSALLVTSFGIGDTMASSVENDYGYLFHFDVISSYAPAQEEAFYEKLDDMQQAGTIAAYERVKTYVATAQASSNKDISVYVIPAGSAMSEIVKGGNTISEITASVLGVKKGDTLTFTLGSCVTSYKIENIVTTSTWNGFFTTEDLFEGCYFTENAWVQTSSPDAVRDELNEVNGTHTAKTMGDRIAEIENMISSTNAMKYTLMVFAVLLSVVVLYNLSLLNVKERTRDMATLKVLGFTDFQVALSLIVEIMLLTLIGTAIGSLLGFPLMYLVMKLNEMATMAFVYSISLTSYIASAAVSLGTAIVINVLFGAVVSKISMTESLKSVE